MALVKTVEMRVLADAGDAQAKLDELDAKAKDLDGNDIKMRFRVLDGEGKAQLDEIKAKADKLGFKDISIKVKVDGAGRAIAELAAVRHEAEKASGGGLLSRIGGAAGGLIGGGFNSAIGAAGNLPLVGGLAGAGSGAGLAVVAAGLAAILTEATAVASGFAAAGAGAGAFALLARPALQQVQTAYQNLSVAQKKYQDAQTLEKEAPSKAHASAVQAAKTNLDIANDAIKKLPAPAQGAVRGISQLSDTYHKMSKAFEKPAFKVFNDGLSIANHLLPAAKPLANSFATSIDGLLKHFDKFTQSKGFADFMTKFGNLVGPAVTAIGNGIGKVVPEFAKLLTMMSGKDVAHGINIAFGTIATVIHGVAASVRFLMQVWDGAGVAFTTGAHTIATAFDTVRHAVAAVVSSVAHGVAQVVTFFVTLPGKIVSALGDLGSILLHAGEAIMGGLLRGITAGWNKVAGFVSGIAGKIASLKGPLPKDLVLLVPHGRAIMEGLIAGMNSRMPALEAMAAKAAKVIADRIKTEIAFAKSVSSATMSGLGLTSIDLSQGTVASGMQSYLASIKAFTAELKQLSAQHLNKSILQQLIAAGPVTGGQYAESILQGGVAPVNALYKQIQQQSALLGAQAAASVYGGKAAVKGDTYNITVQGGIITDEQALAMKIVQILRQYKRNGGGTALGLG